MLLHNTVVMGRAATAHVAFTHYNNNQQLYALVVHLYSLHVCIT